MARFANIDPCEICGLKSTTIKGAMSHMASTHSIVDQFLPKEYQRRYLYALISKGIFLLCTCSCKILFSLTARKNGSFIFSMVMRFKEAKFNFLG